MEKHIRIPAHPGKILLEKFLKPLKLTQYRLAKELRVTPIRISQIIHGKRAITADTAIRLGTLFGMDPLFWMNLQNAYDLDVAMKDFYSSVYQKIKPLVEKENKNNGREKAKHIAARYLPCGKKAADKVPDFSLLLQQGLDSFFLNLQVDKKLRK